MDFINQFMLSFYALIAIIMLTIRIYYKEEVYSYSSKLYRTLLLNVGLVMILEILSWAFDRQPGHFNYLMNYVFNFLLFVYSTVVPSFWLSYIHYKIYGDKEKIRKYLWFLYPAFISLILAIINIAYPIVFRVPFDTNQFERLPLISINFIMVYVMILYSVYLAVKERSRIKPIILGVVLVFLILPSIASVLQYFYFGLILMYPLTTLSMIVVYLFLETQSAATDYLTGAYSRSRFDEYVDNKISKNEKFCVVMLDLDDFKHFNDQYGHAVGDRILIQYVNLAKQVFGANCLVARYGGDEFVVVVPSSNRIKLLEYKEEIKKRISESTDEIFRTVRFSYGYACRTKENQFTYDKLLLDCDKDMYMDKAVNKNFLRRKEDREKANKENKGE